MNNMVNKSSDEEFCIKCGSVIKIKAEICPKCGIRKIKNWYHTGWVWFWLIVFFPVGIYGLAKRGSPEHYKWWWLGFLVVCVLGQLNKSHISSSIKNQEKSDSVEISSTMSSVFSGISTSSSCLLLEDIGLSTTGSWEMYSDNEFGCNSLYKKIGSGTPLANNIAYYADGNRDSVTQVKLVLNVNNKSQTKSAHNALLSASEELSMKIANINLPQSIKEAISYGKPLKDKVGPMSVEIESEYWPTGKGYEIHVIFK